MIWLLTYHGSKRWNYDWARIVRAETAYAACVIGGNLTEWTAEPLPLDGPPEVLLGAWVGDPG